MIRLLVGLGLSAFVLSCSTARPRPEAEPALRAPPPPVAVQMDYPGLERDLNLFRPSTELGYVEKSFDTCSVGRGFSTTENCHRETLVSMQFQLLCREEEQASGTLEVADLTPIDSQIAKWHLSGKSGQVRLDSQGRGKVLATFKSSPKGERVKISVNGNFLIMRIAQLDRVVTPPDWCSQ